MSYEPKCSETTVKLYNALVKAQKAVKPVAKDETMPGGSGGYKYAKSDAIIAECRLALNDFGLSAFVLSVEEILPRPTLTDAEAKFAHAVKSTAMRLWFRLVHDSGEFEVFGPREYPVIVHKGVTVEKSWAAANTLALSSFYRDLLGLAKITEEEYRAYETARKEAENAERTEAERTRSDANRFTSGATTQTAPRGESADMKKMGDELVAMIERPKVKCEVCGLESLREVDKATGEVKGACPHPHKPEPAKTEAPKENPSSASSQPAPTATPTAASSAATQPAASSAGTPSAPSSSAAGTPNNGDNALKGRRASMLRLLGEARKAALAAGVSAEEFKKRVDAKAPGVIGEGRFVLENLTVEALTALNTLYDPDKKALVALAAK